MDTIQEIQAAMDDLARRMSEKVLLNPKAEHQINSGQGAFIWLTWQGAPNPAYKSFRDGDAADQLKSALAWIDALPAPEERHRAAFLQLAGAAADYAAEHLPGDEIATEVRATIVSGMQRLSDNAITSGDVPHVRVEM